MTENGLIAALIILGALVFIGALALTGGYEGVTVYPKDRN